MNRGRPRVSIGLPVYNGERFLGHTLDSLLAQTYSDFELIISDNASTDRTPDVCRWYAGSDRRIRYFRNAQNLGAARNFNRVFELAMGEYFKWASADDVCQPDHLMRCLEVVDNDATVVLAYPQARFIDENGRLLNIHDPGWDLRSTEAHERLRFAIYARHWVNSLYGLIRTRALAKTRMMPAYPAGDYRLLAELALLGKFVEIPDYCFYRRIHSGALSQNNKDFRWTIEFQSGGTGTALPFWHLSVDHLITILKSKLGIQYKLSLFVSLGRSMWRQHDHLLRELVIGLPSFYSRPMRFLKKMAR